MKVVLMKRAITSSNGNINVSRIENTSTGIRADAENRSSKYRTKIDVAIIRQTRDISLSGFINITTVD